MTVYNYNTDGIPAAPVTLDTLLMHGTTYSFDGSAWNVLTNENGGTLDLTNYYTKLQVDSAITTANSGGIPSYNYDKTIVTNTSDTITLPVPHNLQTVTNVKKFVAGDTVTDSHWDFDTGDISSWDFDATELNLHAGKIKVKGVDGAAKVVSFDSNQQSSYIVLSDGTLLAAGYNNYRQLGLGNTVNQESFVVSNITNVASIHCEANERAMALLKDGTVKVVGRNDYGEFGVGDTSNFTEWTTSPITNVKKLSCGDKHSIALKHDGTVWVCGYNNYGQLGLGHTTNTYGWTETEYATSNGIPTTITANIVDVEAGANKSLVIVDQDGIGKCYFAGYGYNGQNGHVYSHTDRHNFYYMDYPGSTGGGAAKASLGSHHNIILLKDGRLCLQGYNNYGQFGIGTTNSQNGTYNWGLISLSVGDVVDVSAGYQYSALLMSNGNIKTAGYNQYGKLGIGHASNEYTWTVAQSVATGVYAGHSNMLSYDDVDIRTTGYNNYGQTGQNNATTQSYIFNPIVYTPVNDIFYSTNAGYCKSISSINLINTDAINSISITDLVPENCEIKYALSFDGKSTWMGANTIYTDTVVGSAAPNTNVATNISFMWTNASSGGMTIANAINGLGNASTNQGWWYSGNVGVVNYDFETPRYLDTVRIQPFVGTTDNFKIIKVVVSGRSAGDMDYTDHITEDYSTARDDEIIVTFPPQIDRLWKVTITAVDDIQIESFSMELNTDVSLPILNGSDGNKIINDISIDGNDSSALVLYDFDGFSGNTLDVGIYMSLTGSDLKISPEVNQITVNMDINGRYIQISPDIGGLEIYETGTHDVVITNTDTIDNTYKITISSP
jgi:alpha-tubulin suppressor-like RCC1 family protein